MQKAQFPGEDLILQGIEDLRTGQETIGSLLVSIGYPQLSRKIPNLPQPLENRPEHRLYFLLAKENPDSAHARYNALIRRLVSYERALACAS